MTTSTKSVLTLALAALTATPSLAGGFRRGSYGGGRRVQAAPASRGAVNQQRSGGNQGGGGLRFTSNNGGAEIRGRGSVGYGQVQRSNYGSSGAGYSRGIGGRSFGGSSSGMAGGSRRSMGTRYEDAPGGGEQQPVQGFAVPGALIRTAGMEHYYNQPSQPAREWALAAGKPEIQSNLAYNETNHASVYRIPGDRNPPPNPGGGYASGGNGATPNSAIAGVGGTSFGTKPNDPSQWNGNGGGN